MILTRLAEAVELAGRIGHLLVTTADGKGIPHLAIAEQIELADTDRVAVTAWFCPQTAENIDKNPQISLVVWDREPDAGFQLIGTVEQMLDLAMLDGFIPGENEAVPQIERKLIIRVRHVLHFSHGHHGDTPLD